MVEGCDAKPYCRVPGDSTGAYNSVGLGSNPLSQPQESRAGEEEQEGGERERRLKKEKEEDGPTTPSHHHHLPDDLPSIVEIRRALPSHVFQPSALLSLLYAARDVALVVGTFLLAEWMWEWGWGGSQGQGWLMPAWTLVPLLPLYWLLQGTFFTAFFVVGHDAGHSSFSNHALLNDVVGTVLHTFLLCPFYCWKLSHRHHHKNTGNIDRDEVFYPRRQKTQKEESNPRSFTLPGFGLGAGWFAYLLVGYGSRPVNHFNPWHPLLRRRAAACLTSVCLVLLWAVVLWRYALSAGALKLLVHYVVPEFVFASYTVVITFLHHTETGVPWYGDSAWGSVRGQLSSVDRHYGWCHSLLHSIGTHQVHHLFPKLPHYHLEEATAAFRQKFPGLVRVRSDPILPAFTRMFRTYMAQSRIPHDAQVHIYT